MVFSVNSDCIVQAVRAVATETGGLEELGRLLQGGR